ncbi:MAG: hypothetical protein ACON4Z_18385 [Planctomycetota bacterium]
MDTHDFLADPRTLNLDQRNALRARYTREQDLWLERLRALAEEPKPADDFPAFLLATAPFRQLAARIGNARCARDLDVQAADELEWFVRGYASYLRTRDGEDAFTQNPRLTG